MSKTWYSLLRMLTVRELVLASSEPNLSYTATVVRDSRMLVNGTKDPVRCCLPSVQRGRPKNLAMDTHCHVVRNYETGERCASRKSLLLVQFLIALKEEIIAL